jgi:DNA-binding NarL/FixJ family response regulator
MEKIKIILVDDHQLVRDGIKALLMGIPDISIIGEASGANELLREL